MFYVTEEGTFLVVQFGWCSETYLENIPHSIYSRKNIKNAAQKCKLSSRREINGATNAGSNSSPAVSEMDGSSFSTVDEIVELSEIKQEFRILYQFYSIQFMI